MKTKDELIKERIGICRKCDKPIFGDTKT